MSLNVSDIQEILVLDSFDSQLSLDVWFNQLLPFFIDQWLQILKECLFVLCAKASCNAQYLDNRTSKEGRSAHIAIMTPLPSALSCC